MKVLSVALSLFLAAGFIIQTAAGLQCDSECAACWKIGAPGVDTKLSCTDYSGHCGDKCPDGYDNMHCAKRGRCHCKEPGCGEFGPCGCGVDTQSTVGGVWHDCKEGGC